MESILTIGTGIRALVCITGDPIVLPFRLSMKTRLGWRISFEMNTCRHERDRSIDRSIEGQRKMTGPIETIYRESWFFTNVPYRNFSQRPQSIRGDGATRDEATRGTFHKELQKNEQTILYFFSFPHSAFEWHSFGVYIAGKIADVRKISANH